MTGEEHNKYLSWTFLGNGLLQSFFLILVYGLIFAWLAATAGSEPNFPTGILLLVFGFAFLFSSALIVPNFIAYYGLKTKKSWARVASIVAGVLSAMNIPIGTAACAYTMWFFFGEEWKPVYPEVAGNNMARAHLPTAPPQNWTGQYVREDGQEVFRPASPPDWR